MKKKTEKSKPAGRLDIIESQIKLYQYCNDMTKKIHDMEMHVNNMTFQMHVLKKENFEIKHLLHGLSSHLQALRDMKRGEDDSWLNDEAPRSPEASPQVKPEEPQVIKKALPLHDDVMMNCEVCSFNHHMNIKTCPKCGFNRLKKDR